MGYTYTHNDASVAQTSIAAYPSRLTLPQLPPPHPPLFDYLCQRFNQIPAQVWQQRFIAGKVLDAQQQALTLESLFVPQQAIYYFREVAAEAHIPFSAEIVYQDDEILLACKPHFLPVIPGGRFVKECLVYRLREQTGIDQLVPVHRLDRHTAGLVLFSINPHTRSCYNELFSQGRIEKHYEALAHYQLDTSDAGNSATQPRSWEVKNRIDQGEPWFLRKVVPGKVNAHSSIILRQRVGHYANFVLQPHTGKTHQLRIHMSNLGFPLVNDRCYPHLLEEQDDDYACPLQLLAKELRFTDPLSGCQHHFVSSRTLSCLEQ